jgi:hypothetical protein
MSDFICEESNNSPVWGSVDLAVWKLVPEKFGGGIPYIQNFKNAWVKNNKTTIILSAKENFIPAQLLAGVCWIEVGGDPNFIDRAAFEIRSFDWSGSEWMDKNMTITSSPQKTSFGAVSMQLRTAAETLGLDPKTMTGEQFRSLANCLQKDVFNIKLVARHLKQLIDHDTLQCSSNPVLSNEQIRIAGTRYNRGISLSLEDIKKNTSYGDFIVNRLPLFIDLLK